MMARNHLVVVVGQVDVTEWNLANRTPLKFAHLNKAAGGFLITNVFISEFV